MTINLLGRNFEIKKSVLVLGIIATVIIAGGTGLLISNSGGDIIIEGKNLQSEGCQSTAATTIIEDRENIKKTENKQEEELIKVYIVGCVKKPGVITLKKGQLIDDAVRSAGGLTPEADPNSINMVFELKENVMLYIQPRENTDKSFVNQGYSGKTGSEQESAAGKGVKIVIDSGSAVISGQSTVSNNAAGTKNGKINLNTASAAELDTLPGIGEATAMEIINYREKNGPFKSIKDIMKISRIKDSRFNAIKDYITID